MIAAATIMAAVFAGFAFSNDSMVASIGLALAVGVLVDALVVRMILVPAALELLGEASWWIPRWLDRILPNITIEPPHDGEAPAPAGLGKPEPSEA